MGNFLGSVPYLDKNSENEQRNYVISRSNMSKKLLENLSFNIFFGNILNFLSIFGDSTSQFNGRFLVVLGLCASLRSGL